MSDPRIFRIVVKAGNNVLSRADATLDITRMSASTEPIAKLHKHGEESEINYDYHIDE